MFTPDQLTTTYQNLVLLVAAKAVLWFIVLFVVIPRLVFPRDLHIGGTITRRLLSTRLFAGYARVSAWLLLTGHLLVLIQAYEFFTLLVLIGLLPLLPRTWRTGPGGLPWWERTYEGLLGLMEQPGRIQAALRQWVGQVRAWRRPTAPDLIWSVLGAAIIALAASLRFWPVWTQAAPLRREWFADVERLKLLDAGQLYGTYVSPAGMYLFVDAFSKLTQINPGLVLHLFGVLVGVLLTAQIAWLGQRVSGTRPLAGWAGALLFGVLPHVVTPVMLANQIEASARELALTFVLSSFVLCLVYVRSGDRRAMAASLAAAFATGLTHLPSLSLIGLLVVFPALLVPPVGVWLLQVRRIGLAIGGLVVVSGLCLVPLVWQLAGSDVGIELGLRRLLLDPSAYHEFGSLLLPYPWVLQLGLWVGAVLVVSGWLGWAIGRRTGRPYTLSVRRVTIGLALLVLAAVLSLAEQGVWLGLFDPELLPLPLAVLLATGLGVLVDDTVHLPAMFMGGRRITGRPVWRWAAAAVLVSGGLGLAVWSGGLRPSQVVSTVVPEGFMKAYYRLDLDNLPYTWSMVGFPAAGVLAMNRHYFMDYNYFLSEYPTFGVPVRTSEGPRQPGRDFSPSHSVYLFVDRQRPSQLPTSLLYDATDLMERADHYGEQLARRRAGVTEPSPHDPRVRLLYEDPGTRVYWLEHRGEQTRLTDLLNQADTTSGARRRFWRTIRQGS